MKPIIVTNNPKVSEKYNELYKTIFIQGNYIEVLIATRDFIHKGHKLLTHPLSGSIKPNETPYKSVLISETIKKTQMNSVALIEDSIHTANKFMEMKNTPRWKDSVLEDFVEIDLRLLEGAIESIRY